jgi:PBP1b-binding outer membrane lipoprotein LpoB
MNRTVKTLGLVLLSGAASLLIGCVRSSAPTRIQSGGPTAITTMGVDLADFKNAAGDMVKEMLVHPDVGGFAQQKGRKPLVDIGVIKNNSDVNIDLGQLSGRINEDLLNSGLVEIMANDAGAVDEAAKKDWVNDRKRSSVQEADYLLEGVIMLVTGRVGNTHEKTYTFQLRLNQTSSRKTIWQKTVDVTKQGKRAAAGVW